VWPAGQCQQPAHAGSARHYKIQHVIIVMQENRSFDSYFGGLPKHAPASWQTGGNNPPGALDSTRRVGNAVAKPA